MDEEAQPRVSRRGIWGWMFFDWAAQPFHTLIITFVFAPYFASAVAATPAEGQEYWGYATGFGGLLIAFMAPILGAMADATGPRKPWIIVFSALGIAGCWALWYATPGMGVTPFVLIAVVIALIGMEFAAVFNNAMMPDLVPRAELGRLSGSAWGLGYLGGLVSLVLVLGFLAGQPATGKTLLGFTPLFGLDSAAHEGDRVSGPLTAIWYALFLLPMLFFTPDAPRKPRVVGIVAQSLRELGQTLKQLPSQRSYFSFLLSSMFYRDALNALYTFGGIYAAGVLQWSIIQIGIFGILANLTGAFGAWFGGIMDQRYGPRIVVQVSIFLLALCCFVIISTTPSEVFFVKLANANSALPDIVFYIAGGLIGAAGGSIQAASRTLLVDQVPHEKVTEAFGLYALSGRATAFMGPLLIAWVTGITDSQRLGVSPVIALFVIGMILLMFVKSRYEPRAAEAPAS